MPKKSNFPSTFNPDKEPTFARNTPALTVFDKGFTGEKICIKQGDVAPTLPHPDWVVHTYEGYRGSHVIFYEFKVSERRNPNYEKQQADYFRAKEKFDNLFKEWKQLKEVWDKELKVEELALLQSLKEKYELL